MKFTLIALSIAAQALFVNAERGPTIQACTAGWNKPDAGVADGGLHTYCCAGMPTHGDFPHEHGNCYQYYRPDGGNRKFSISAVSLL